MAQLDQVVFSWELSLSPVQLVQGVEADVSVLLFGAHEISVSLNVDILGCSCLCGWVGASELCRHSLWNW